MMGLSEDNERDEFSKFIDADPSPIRNLKTFNPIN
jgi:hypothetical protein